MFTNSLRILRNRGIFLNLSQSGGYVRTIYKGDTPRLFKLNSNASFSVLGLRTQNRYTNTNILGDSYFSSLCFVFGSGTAEETLEDYTLDAPLTEDNSSIIHVYTENTYEYSNNISTFTVKTAISAQDSPLTIKEYGIVSNGTNSNLTQNPVNYNGAFTSTSGSKEFILYYRGVLPEEQWVNMEAGETREFTFVISNIEGGFQT